jgi:hypothetical protein
MKDKRHLVSRIATGASIAYLLLWLLAWMLTHRLGQFLIFWVLFGIGWAVPLTAIDSFFDPGADNTGIIFGVAAALSAINAMFFMRSVKSH